MSVNGTSEFSRVGLAASRGRTPAWSRIGWGSSMRASRGQEVPLHLRERRRGPHTKEERNRSARESIDAWSTGGRALSPNMTRERAWS